MPILHHPTLRLDESHWILGLAVVTIGSHMSDFEQSEDFSLCLDEFLRRAISTSVSIFTTQQNNPAKSDNADA